MSLYMILLRLIIWVCTWWCLDTDCFSGEGDDYVDYVDNTLKNPVSN